MNNYKSKASNGKDLNDACGRRAEKRAAFLLEGRRRLCGKVHWNWSLKGGQGAALTCSDHLKSPRTVQGEKSMRRRG